MSRGVDRGGMTRVPGLDDTKVQKLVGPASGGAPMPFRRSVATGTNGAGCVVEGDVGMAWLRYRAPDVG